MKVVGYILIAFGLALFVFLGYGYLKEKNRVISPIPEEKGVKVIFVTPTNNK